MKSFAITQDSMMIVRLEIEEQDGQLLVTSPNLPGLNVCGADAEATYQSVVRMVKALYRHNAGFEVEVWPGTTDSSEFPKMTHLCQEVVVRRKTARKADRPGRAPESLAGLEAIQ